MAFDIRSLWDFGDPAGSEARFRAALATLPGDSDDALNLRSQIARSASLRQRFDEAHRELDAVAPLLGAAGPEPRARHALERGRTFRSAQQPEPAAPCFERAFEVARSAGLEALAGDALHMLALVMPTLDGQLSAHERAAAFARAASDPAARRWEAVALNNAGVALNEAGRHDEALTRFEQALVAYESNGSAGDVRIARWQVAHTLRRLGRVQQALALQQSLEQACAAAGEPDPYVFEELALLHEAEGRADEAARYRGLQLSTAPDA